MKTVNQPSEMKNLLDQRSGEYEMNHLEIAKLAGINPDVVRRIMGMGAGTMAYLEKVLDALDLEVVVE